MSLDLIESVLHLFQRSPAADGKREARMSELESDAQANATRAAGHQGHFSLT